jgi:hypothetical protein
MLIDCQESQISELREILEGTQLETTVENDELWFESDEFLPLTSSAHDTATISEIWKKVREQIAEINGVAIILNLEAWEPIALKNKQWEDDTGLRRWFPITASTQIFLQDSSALINKRQDLKAKTLHPATKYLIAAVSDKSVAKVLRLVNRGMDQVNLYRILELIKEDIGGYKQIEANGWASVQEIKAFTGSANNASVSGDDSRHGSIKNELPKKVVNLKEAQHFIDQIMRKWLAQKTKMV